MKIQPGLLFLTLLFGGSAFAQSEEMSRLRQQLPKTKDTLRYVDGLNRLGMLMYENNVDSSFYFTEKALAISDRHHYAKGKAAAANNLGVVYYLNGNLQLALRYYNDAYNRYNKLNDTADAVQPIMNIAMVYQSMDKNQRAIASFRQAVAMGAHLRRDSIMALVYYNFLLVYPGAFKKDSTQLYINKAVKIATKYKDTRVLLAIEQLTADFYIKNGQRERGIALLKRTVAKAINGHLYFLSLDMLNDLGDLFTASNSDEALTYYKQGLGITRQNGYLVYTEVITKRLYDFYNARKDTTNAFYYSRQLVQLHEQLEKNDSNSGIDYLQYAIKDQQLESARVESSYRLWFLWLATLLGLTAIIASAILWRNWRKLRTTTGALRQQFSQTESTMESLDVMNKNYARLIKIVAHDLRNPIAAINSITALVDPAELLTDETREYMELIRVSSNNCLELINELLSADFDPEQNLNLEEFDPNELLQQCVTLLRLRAADKEQQLVLNSDGKVKIMADREKLWRVLDNLIVNAMKFSPSNSTIVIETSRTDQNFIIKVEDTGMGMSAEQQSKIFDPFTMARREGTDGEKSFGLGLYISKQIIDAHKGKLWLVSQPGKGTIFYIEIPLIQEVN